jgi:hypothetical protein
MWSPWRTSRPSWRTSPESGRADGTIDAEADVDAARQARRTLCGELAQRAAPHAATRGVRTQRALAVGFACAARAGHSGTAGSRNAEHVRAARVLRVAIEARPAVVGAEARALGGHRARAAVPVARAAATIEVRARVDRNTSVTARATSGATTCASTIGRDEAGLLNAGGVQQRAVLARRAGLTAGILCRSTHALALRVAAARAGQASAVLRHAAAESSEHNAQRDQPENRSQRLTTNFTVSSNAPDRSRTSITCAPCVAGRCPVNGGRSSIARSPSTQTASGPEDEAARTRTGIA